MLSDDFLPAPWILYGSFPEFIFSSQEDRNCELMVLIGTVQPSDMIYVFSIDLSHIWPYSYLVFSASRDQKLY